MIYTRVRDSLSFISNLCKKNIMGKRIRELEIEPWWLRHRMPNESMTKCSRIQDGFKISTKVKFIFVSTVIVSSRTIMIDNLSQIKKGLDIMRTDSDARHSWTYAFYTYTFIWHCSYCIGFRFSRAKKSSKMSYSDISLKWYKQYSVLQI